jgi:hypothetical protein
MPFRGMGEKWGVQSSKIATGWGAIASMAETTLHLLTTGDNRTARTH